MGQLRSIKSRKEKGKRKKKVITFLLSKAIRYKDIAPNQLQLLFTRVIPHPGSGGQNRLRMSQRKGTEAGRSMPELAAMVYA